MNISSKIKTFVKHIRDRCFNNGDRACGQDSSEPDNQLKVKVRIFINSLKEDKKKRYKFMMLVTVIVAIYISGLMCESMYSNEMNGFYWNPFIAIYVAVLKMPLSLFYVVIICGLTAYGIFWYERHFAKSYVLDEERNVKVAKDDGTYGTAHFMTDSEEEKCMYMKKKAEEIWADILGRDNKGYLVARKPLRFTNENVICIGPPGSGKSTSILNSDILQIIKRGESGIVIDCKGAIYRDTAYAAKKAGYNIKVINTIPTEIEHSDACDFFKIITDRKTAKSRASSLATTIMMNIKDENVKKDIWYTGAFNLLISLILATKYNEELDEDKRTFGTMYQFMVDHSSVEELEEALSYIGTDRKHPAYEAWRTFTGTRDVVKESILGGLLTDLHFMSDDLVREMVSHDEVDFKAPGYEKCMYYIMIDDDGANGVLAALFLECICQTLKRAADNEKSGAESRLPIKVGLIIDEFKNVGKLPSMTVKLSTYRSRGIYIKIFIQDFVQLMQMYPNDGWREFVVDCTTLLVLKVGEQQTAEYIEKRMGTQTVIVENASGSETKSELIHLRENQRKAEGRGQRPLMTAAEIQGEGEYGLKNDEMIVIMDGQAPIILKKWFWQYHPIAKALHLGEPSRQIFARAHIPEWYKEYEKEHQFDDIRKNRYTEEELLEEGDLGAADFNFQKMPTPVKLNAQQGTKQKIGVVRNGFKKSNSL